MKHRQRFLSSYFLPLKKTALLLVCVLALSNAIAFAENQTQKDSLISNEEFLQSPAASFFQEENYEMALQSLDGLIQKYPNDPLLLRYKAMTLDRMGRSQEAIKIYQNLLKSDPNHIPTHFFLGQAYARSGAREEAFKEWEWARSYGEGTPYREWAEDSLKRFNLSKDLSLQQKPKRFTFNGMYGYEYDSNVILQPENESLANDTDKSAGRHVLDANLKYRAYTSRDIALDLAYAARQSFHDDSLDEFNFTSQEFTIHPRIRNKILGKDVVFGTKYDFMAGHLDGQMFSIRNRWTISADTRLSKQTRTVPYYHFEITNYRQDGTNSSQTSRDGIYQDLGVTQYFYTRDLKRYVFIQGEYNRADVEGGNYEMRGSTARLGIHTPLVWKVDLDAMAGLQYGNYPRFSSLSTLDTNSRRDLDWDFYAALTRPLTSHIGVRFFYRYIEAMNRNGFYDYHRHIGGVQVLLSEGF